MWVFVGGLGSAEQVPCIPSAAKAGAWVKMGARFAREKQVLRCAQNDNQNSNSNSNSNSKAKAKYSSLSTAPRKRRAAPVEMTDSWVVVIKLLLDGFLGEGGFEGDLGGLEEARDGAAFLGFLG